MSVVALFGVGLALVLLKWAMDELLIYRRPRRQSRPPMRGPVMPTMPFDDSDEGSEL
jgi:hypothetical protein